MPAAAGALLEHEFAVAIAAFAGAVGIERYVDQGMAERSAATVAAHIRGIDLDHFGGRWRVGGGQGGHKESRHSLLR